MGSGIAQVAATSDAVVKIFDQDPSALESAKMKLEKILSRLIEKGRINSAEKERIQNNIKYTSKLEDLFDSELIIEAIIEDLEIKQKLFKSLEKGVSSNCILATNTSSLSVSAIASSLDKPERCIGIHFFNPAPLMKLVEVVPAIQSSEKIVNSSTELIRSWGKTVAVAKDTPGFIVNRVARPFYSEALRIYEEGLAEIEIIDETMRSLGGFRMGPFELMDFIGNDVNYAVTESVFKSFYYDPRYKPSFTQKRLAEANYLGRKTGRGYYKYDENGTKISNSSGVEGEQFILDRILAMLINEAADAHYLNIASAEDIDIAMTKGVNYPKGLLAWADELGIDWCVKTLDELYFEYHEDRYRCSPLLRKMKREGKQFFDES